MARGQPPVPPAGPVSLCQSVLGRRAGAAGVQMMPVSALVLTRQIQGSWEFSTLQVSHAKDKTLDLILTILVLKM